MRTDGDDQNLGLCEYIEGSVMHGDVESPLFPTGELTASVR